MRCFLKTVGLARGGQKREKDSIATTQPSTKPSTQKPNTTMNEDEKSNDKSAEKEAPMLQEWTIANTKLCDFNPPGLEVDDEAGDDPVLDNPYLVNPVERPTAEEHVRPWHEYKYGTRYFLPNDNLIRNVFGRNWLTTSLKTELSRLDRQHIMWTQILDGDLAKAPIRDPKHVLDLGTGSGIWAVDFAKEHPGSQVLGIDLSKPTPKEIPTNCSFEERDFMDPWVYAEKFDYIHGRLIFVAQSNPYLLLKAAYENLAPGGYLEFHELYGVLMSPDDSISGSIQEKFFFNTVVASLKLGNDMLTLPKFKSWMSKIGFENVIEEQRALPLNPWPKGKYKAVGAMQRENLKVGIAGIYTRILINGLGWTPERTAEEVRMVGEDVLDRNKHGYFPIFIVHGRKPLNAA